MSIDRSLTPARRTGTRDGQEALREANLPLPSARGTRLGVAARLLPRAPARVARLRSRDLELRLQSVGSLEERDFEVVAEVITAARAGAPAAFAAEEALEQILEDRAEPDVTESTGTRHGPEAIVLGALLGV